MHRRIMSDQFLNFLNNVTCIYMIYIEERKSRYFEFNVARDGVVRQFCPLSVQMHLGGWNWRRSMCWRLTLGVCQWCPGPTVIESDSARIVAALETTDDDRSELRWIILETKEHLQLLPEWKIEKVKRENNKVAHELAQLARRNVHTVTWWRQTPTCVYDLLNDDCKFPPG